jgi:ketosteroid isomerase-like protein
MLVVSAAVVLVVVPGMAVAGTGTGAPTSDDAQMIADAIRAEDHIVIAYNDKNWDDLRALYMDDALMLPPNHEPVRGRDAIVEYLRGLRDAAGPISKIEHVRVRGSGTLANLVGKFSIQSGQVRMMTNEVYERQPDGSVLSGIDEFSFRDAAS